MMACGGVWSSLEEGRPGGAQKEIPIRNQIEQGDPAASEELLPLGKNSRLRRVEVAVEVGADFAN
jgi:hypothetical protein